MVAALFLQLVGAYVGVNLKFWLNPVVALPAF